jgi:hypothetical protein
MKNDAFLFLWAKLARIVRGCSTGLSVIVDEPGHLRIESRSGRPFVNVRIQRNHVGVYLLPMYYHPEVLGPLSERKSGKGTLRFYEEEDPLIDELSGLIERSVALVGHY